MNSIRFIPAFAGGGGGGGFFHSLNFLSFFLVLSLITDACFGHTDIEVWYMLDKHTYIW